MSSSKLPDATTGASVDDAPATPGELPKMFIGFGGNFVAAVPDKPLAEAAMRRIRRSMVRLCSGWRPSEATINTTRRSMDWTTGIGACFGGRMVVFMNEIDMKDRGIAPGALVEIESLADGWTEASGTRLQGTALRHPAGFDRRLLPRNQSIAPLGLPRFEKQKPGGEIDPGFGQAAMRDVQRVPYGTYNTGSARSFQRSNEP